MNCQQMVMSATAYVINLVNLALPGSSTASWFIPMCSCTAVSHDRLGCFNTEGLGVWGKIWRGHEIQILFLGYIINKCAFINLWADLFWLMDQLQISNASQFHTFLITFYSIFNKSFNDSKNVKCFLSSNK